MSSLKADSHNSNPQKTSQAILMTKGKEMKMKTGVWIDHRKAVVVQITDNEEETRQINSDVVRPFASAGGPGSKQPQPDPIWLHADPARLEQVVVNLLSNAAKYTEEGGRRKDESGTDSSASPLIPHPSPLKVLVVDDNADTVLSLEMLLKTLGHQIRTAHDGPTAVQVALDYRPNVVLLDIGLPGLNGYEVAKRLRQQPDFKNVVLVALTGYGQDSDRQISLRAGFNHHLVKPARLAQLQQILATVSLSGMALATGGMTPKPAQETGG